MGIAKKLEFHEITKIGKSAKIADLGNRPKEGKIDFFSIGEKRSKVNLWPRKRVKDNRLPALLCINGLPGLSKNILTSYGKFPSMNTIVPCATGKNSRWSPV